MLSVCSVWADLAVPVGWFCIEAGFLLSRKNSGKRHSCPEEMSCGFLRPSLEETLAFNRSRSVAEEEEAGVQGTYHVRFLLFSFCLSCVFFCCFSFCRFPLSSLDFRMLVTLLCGDASAPLTGFLLLRLAPVAKEGPKTEVVDFLSWRSPGQGLSVACEGFCRRVFRAM